MVLPKRTNQPTSISSKTASQNAQEKQSAQLPKAVSAGSEPPNRTIANIKSSSGSKAPSIVNIDEPTASTNIQVDSDKDHPISISSQTAAQDAQEKQSAQGFSTKQPKGASNGSNPSDPTVVDPKSTNPTTLTSSETPVQGAEAKQSAQDFSPQQPKAASDGFDPSNASDGSNPPSNTTEAQGKPSAQSLSTDQKGTPLRRSEPSPPTKEKEEDSDSDLCIYPLSTEENQFLEVIAEKHGSNSTDFDLDLLMRVLNAIYQHSRSEMGFKDNGDQETDSNLDASAVDIGNDIRDIIQHLTMLIEGKYVQDMEVHEIAISIFDVLMNRAWEDKIVLISAAFIVSYSNFASEVLQRTRENPRLQSLSALNKRASPIKREELSSTFMTLSNLVKKLLEVCTLMIQFKEERGRRNIQDIKEKVMKVLHMVTYLIIKIVVTCSMYMESIKTDVGYTTSNTNINLLNSFLKELTDTQKYVTELMSTIASHELQDSSPTGIQDIHQFLRKFFSEEKVLNGGEVSLKELNGNTTAFLISDLNVSFEKLTALTQTYNKIHEEKKFKIVWIPMVDLSTMWTEVEEKCFSSIASSMQWYWCHPSIIPTSFSSHLTNEWQYQKEPRLVVLDEKANVKSTNALPLVEAWGALAFPFSNDVEDSISQSWSIEQMIKDLEIKTNLETAILCIYGGYDIEMNKSFAENVDKINSVKSNQIMSFCVGTDKDLQSITDSLQERNITCGKGFVEMMIYKKSTELIKSSGEHLLECFNMLIDTNPKFGTTDELWKLLIRYLKGENNDMVSEGITFNAYKKIDLEKLKGKSVGFLITGSNINENELTSIKQSYSEMIKGKDFEIIWIPMVATNTEGISNFSEVTGSISWYWCEPSMLTKDFSIYIEQEWYFQKKSVMVILDNKGQLISILPLVEKWGPSAFPWALEITSPAEPEGGEEHEKEEEEEEEEEQGVNTFDHRDFTKYMNISSKANLSFSLGIRHGLLVMVPKNLKDRNQQWIPLKSSVLDSYGEPSFLMVNKGNGHAIQHRGRYNHVQLVPYDNSYVDHSLIWSKREKISIITPVDDANARLDVYGGVVRDGATLCLAN